jgi:hypothetical protein
MRGGGHQKHQPKDKFIMNEATNKSPGKKDVTVIFNGRAKVVEKDFLTFAEIVALSFDNPPTGDGVDFTIQYTKGHSGKPKGSLVAGESVKVNDGMEFDVTPTNRS